MICKFLATIDPATIDDETVYLYSSEFIHEVCWDGFKKFFKLRGGFSGGIIELSDKDNGGVKIETSVTNTPESFEFFKEQEIYLDGKFMDVPLYRKVEESVTVESKVRGKVIGYLSDVLKEEFGDKVPKTLWAKLEKVDLK